MNLNEYNALRRVTDAVRAADSAFCEDFYNDEQLTEKTYELLKDLLDNLSDLYSISDMIIDNETYRRDARKRRRIFSGEAAQKRPNTIKKNCFKKSKN